MAVPKQRAVTISEITSANAYPAPSKNAFGTPRTRHGLARRRRQHADEHRQADQPGVVARVLLGRVEEQPAARHVEQAERLPLEVEQ